ncbi:MAG: exodeoxyribonuclease V subunit gamma [Thermodesulfobacteriota bacterium]|nr:exodeoxyribonuclease V subunit gamma [Thermodesulfobacteriota bacterium]
MTTTLRLFTSNRLEILAEALAENLRRPLSSPLAQEIILVQSKGMERWVCAQLAKGHGICANCRFPFPNRFVYELFQKVFEDLPEWSPFDPRILTWKTMKLLPSFITQPGFESLRRYLKGPGEDLKRFQLCERIADTFDQYLLFRPEMILRWQENKEDHWQAALWRALAKGHEGWHRPALAKAFFEALKTDSLKPKDLPQRVSVFGISALPRFHMEILSGISRFVPVNLFLLNPCKEYWGDIVSDWEIKRTLTREGAGDSNAEAFHLERGNSLLASMGKLGRDFFDMINDFNCEEVFSFREPGRASLLSSLQSDILHLREKTASSGDKRAISCDDMSIQIQSCHSPMREIEVLHDHLLDMFEKDSSLRPKDVLVMTPDIDTYAPYIQAVFDVQADDGKRFPYSIADRSARKESEILDTFLAILGLFGSRFGVSQVLAILEARAVQRKFGLLEADLSLVRRWVTETRIRWGVDADGRAQLGLPAFSENTWKAGLERLLLGYAMAGEGRYTFKGVLPYDQVEGSAALVLGGLLHFADELFACLESLSQSRTLDQWSETLTGLLDRFFLPEEDEEHEAQVIRRTLKELGDMPRADRSGFDDAVDFSVIKWYLGSRLEKEGFGFGFIAGGITFCAMLPMRSIPFRIICLVGMNGDAYPRQSKPLGFDLMATHPKPGDRSRRHDDRYLFLEALLSARERLYVSYVGQNIKDNTTIPPSVLVSEVMDYIRQGFQIEGRDMADHIVTTHRLQAFSPEYFQKDERLFSYSEANCQAARCLVQHREEPLAFISRGLSDPPEEWETVQLDDLCRFFGNPAKFLLNRRLGIYLEQEASVLDERESFQLKGLEKYLLEKGLLEKGFSGGDLKEQEPIIRASGQLPHGAVGKCLYEEICRGVEGFVRKTEPFVQGPTLRPLDVDLQLSRFRLLGTIGGIYPERLVQYRYAKVTAKDRLRLWIHHVAVNSLKADHYPRTSMLVGLRFQSTDRKWSAWEYGPVQKSEEILLDLLETYWKGLKTPLHFSPESSWAYADRRLKKQAAPDDALHRARSVWLGGDYSRGEGEDDYYRLCFRATDLLDRNFQHTAELIFGPLLAHQREEE